jgi:hypothetical protein
VKQPFVAETARRRAAGGLRRARLIAAHTLFSRGHSSRHFDGLWFKVFCERGPC